MIVDRAAKDDRFPLHVQPGLEPRVEIEGEPVCLRGCHACPGGFLQQLFYVLVSILDGFAGCLRLVVVVAVDRADGGDEVGHGVRRLQLLLVIGRSVPVARRTSEVANERDELVDVQILSERVGQALHGPVGRHGLGSCRAARALLTERLTAEPERQRPVGEPVAWPAQALAQRDDQRVREEVSRLRSRNVGHRLLRAR